MSRLEVLLVIGVTLVLGGVPLVLRADGLGAGDPGLGLTGMGERLDALGGDMRIANAEGGGARLAVHLPFEQVAQ